MRQNPLAAKRFEVQTSEMRFREKLRKLARNQSELARRTGLAPSAINEMAAGRRRPYLDQGFAIARALGVPLDYLADDSQDSPPVPELTAEQKEMLWMLERAGITDKSTLFDMILAFRAGKSNKDDASRQVLRPVGVRDITAQFTRGPKGIANSDDKITPDLRDPDRRK